MMIENEYRCADCGRLTDVLHETDDFAWVCGDCRVIHNELSDPDCNLEEPL